MAQAQTQLTLFVDPQSISLECEHGSGATRFEVQLGPRTQPELVHQHRPGRDSECRTVTSSRIASQKRSKKVTDEEMDEMIEIVEVVCSITQERIPRNESQSRLRHGHVARSRQLKQ